MPPDMFSPSWTDAHCHLQDPMFGTQLDEVFRRSETFSISRWIVNGTSPADWPAVAELSQSRPGVLPQFGVHPWKVEDLPPHWESTLKEMLLRFPQAGIGEIGLDRKLTSAPLDLQLEVFHKQLRLANEFDRCCTIHLVSAWQELDHALKECHPSRCLLHSFGGSPEQARSYAEKGCWFSVGGSVLRQPEDKAQRTIRAIPDSLLLLETDAPYQHPAGRTQRQEPAGILKIAERVARLKGIPVDRLREQTEENVLRFLGASTQA